MTTYRCDFLGPDGRLAAQRTFEADSDDDAIIVARALYAERASRDGIELWQNGRRVYEEDALLPSGEPH